MTIPKPQIGSAKPPCRVCLRHSSIWASFSNRARLNEDKFEAYIWLLVSSDAGNQTVASDLAALEGELGGNRVDEAKNKVRDLEQTVTRAVVSRGCDWAGALDRGPTPPPPDVQRFCR